MCLCDDSIFDHLAAELKVFFRGILCNFLKLLLVVLQIEVQILLLLLVHLLLVY